MVPTMLWATLDLETSKRTMIRCKTPPDGSVLNLDSEDQQKERSFSPTCLPIKMKIIGDLLHKICFTRSVLKPRAAVGLAEKLISLVPC